MKILGKAARSLPLALVAASLMMGTAPAKAEATAGCSIACSAAATFRYKPRYYRPRRLTRTRRRRERWSQHRRSPVRATTITSPIRWCASISRRCAPARKGHLRAGSRRPVDQRSGGRAGRLRPVCREGHRSGDLRLLFGQSAIHLGDRRKPSTRRPKRRSACSAPPTATGCRRPTMPSPSRRRPPMAAMRRRAWPSWCASR